MMPAMPHILQSAFDAKKKDAWTEPCAVKPPVSQQKPKENIEHRLDSDAGRVQLPEWKTGFGVANGEAERAVIRARKRLNQLFRNERGEPFRRHDVQIVDRQEFRAKNGTK